MKIIKAKKLSPAALAAVVRLLKKGGVIVFPTDTAYGLGCDATNARAVRRIFSIKGREKGKATPLIVADKKMAESFFNLTTKDSQLATKYWPGPLSLVLKSAKKIAAEALSAGTAAVRVPYSDLTRKISRALGKPVAATSANVSGQPAAYSVRSFIKQIRGNKALPDIIIDAGALRHRKPSTIVRTAANTVTVLRQGPIRFKKS